MHVKKDDMPLVAAPLDDLWVVFRDHEDLAVVWVEALTANATVEVDSGPFPDKDLLSGAPTVLTFTQKRVRQRVLLPNGGTTTDKATRIKPTDGRIAVSVAAPSDFRFFIENSQVFET